MSKILSALTGNTPKDPALWDDLQSLSRMGAALVGASLTRATPAKLRDNLVLRAVILLGGYTKTGRICDVDSKSVMKWTKQKRLPQTEATGFTQYAATMAKANPEINEEALRATAFRKKEKVRRVNDIGRPSFR